MSIWKVKPLAKLMQDSQEKEGGLKRSLSSGALIALGIGAIIGAGLFSLTGIAAADHAGPAVTLSFVLAAVGSGGCIWSVRPATHRSTGNAGTV